jgi:hypothetical protein
MDKDKTESKELWTRKESKELWTRTESKELWTRTGRRVKNYGQG